MYNPRRCYPTPKNVAVSQHSETVQVLDRGTSRSRYAPLDHTKVCQRFIINRRWMSRLRQCPRSGPLPSIWICNQRLPGRQRELEPRLSRRETAENVASLPLHVPRVLRRRRYQAQRRPDDQPHFEDVAAKTTVKKMRGEYRGSAGFGIHSGFRPVFRQAPRLAPHRTE